MPETLLIAQVERRLLELGCPRRWLRDKVRELADHYDDLKRAALDEGLPETEAAARANAQLGDPAALAENAAALLRQSSWWGRHTIIGCCVLPPLVFAPLWLGCAMAVAGAGRVLSLRYGPACDFAARVNREDPALFSSLIGPINSALNFSTHLLSGLMVCWIIRRSAAGVKWMWIACAVCSLNGLFVWAGIQPRAFFIGYTWDSPTWNCGTIPLLIAAGAFLQRREAVRRLPPIPGGGPASRRRSKTRWFPSLRSVVRTPTYWLIAILGGTAVSLIASGVAWQNELETKIWPVERAATLERIQARQSSAGALNATTIPLDLWQNATLLDSTDGPDDVKENNLAELPAGIHIFGGVPFDVRGKVQLAGEASPRSRRGFPVGVNGIPIGRRCDRIHLLHGASRLWTRGQKVARLVLRYADGSRAEIGIVGGKDVKDWWGPIYQTDAGNETLSPGTELAWSGGNPWIKRRAPDDSLRLYRSSFANPRPDLSVTSLDYISTLGGAAPFLVGLTTGP